MFTNPSGSVVIQTSFVSPLLFILSNDLLKYFILEPNKTQCSVCLKFIHRNTISRHMKNLHGDSPRVQCQHCEKICKNLTSYEDHLRRDHSIYQSNWEKTAIKTPEKVYQSDWISSNCLRSLAAGQDPMFLLRQGVSQGQSEQTREEYTRTCSKFPVSILSEEL